MLPRALYFATILKKKLQSTPLIEPRLALIVEPSLCMLVIAVTKKLAV